MVEVVFKVSFPLVLVSTDLGIHWGFRNGIPVDNKAQPVLFTLTHYWSRLIQSKTAVICPCGKEGREPCDYWRALFTSSQVSKPGLHSMVPSSACIGFPAGKILPPFHPWYSFSMKMSSEKSLELWNSLGARSHFCSLSAVACEFLVSPNFFFCKKCKATENN